MMQTSHFALPLALGLLLGPFAAAAPAAAQSPPQDRTIAVTGLGRVEREPDRAQLQIAVEREAPTAAEAMRENARAMEAVLEALRAQGVPRERITTTGLQLHPQYSQERPQRDQPPRIVGYRALNSVRVTVDDLPRTGQVIDAAIAAGANRVDGIWFQLRDTEAARQEALRRAVAAARAEAETLASSVGERLGPPISVRTAETPVPVPPPMVRAMAEAADFAVGVPVEPGLMELVAHVTIVYALAPN